MKVSESMKQKGANKGCKERELGRKGDKRGKKEERVCKMVR